MTTPKPGPVYVTRKASELREGDQVVIRNASGRAAGTERVARGAERLCSDFGNVHVGMGRTETMIRTVCYWENEEVEIRG